VTTVAIVGNEEVIGGKAGHHQHQSMYDKYCYQSSLDPYHHHHHHHHHHVTRGAPQLRDHHYFYPPIFDSSDERDPLTHTPYTYLPTYLPGIATVVANGGSLTQSIYLPTYLPPPYLPLP